MFFPLKMTEYKQKYKCKCFIVVRSGLGIETIKKLNFVSVPRANFSVHVPINFSSWRSLLNCLKVSYSYK